MDNTIQFVLNVVINWLQTNTVVFFIFLCRKEIEIINSAITLPRLKRFAKFFFHSYKQNEICKWNLWRNFHSTVNMWLLYLVKAVPQTLHSKIGSYTPFILPFEASGNVIYLILLAAPSYQYVFTGDFFASRFSICDGFGLFCRRASLLCARLIKNAWPNLVLQVLYFILAHHNFFHYCFWQRTVCLVAQEGEYILSTNTYGVGHLYKIYIAP